MARHLKTEVRTMDVILMHEHFDEQHLAEVMDEMRTLGAPVIRAVHLDGDLWVAE